MAWIKIMVVIDVYDYSIIGVGYVRCNAMKLGQAHSYIVTLFFCADMFCLIYYKLMKYPVDYLSYIILLQNTSGIYICKKKWEKKKLNHLK